MDARSEIILHWLDSAVTNIQTAIQDIEELPNAATRDQTVVDLELALSHLQGARSDMEGY